MKKSKQILYLKAGIEVQCLTIQVLAKRIKDAEAACDALKDWSASFEQLPPELGNPLSAWAVEWRKDRV